VAIDTSASATIRLANLGRPGFASDSRWSPARWSAIGLNEPFQANWPGHDVGVGQNDDPVLRL
jgi:hypothetical protein